MGEWLVKIIFAVCTMGCGVCIFWYGTWIKGLNKPVGFWSNKPFHPERVTDVPAYNRENGKLFQYFGVPPCLSGTSMLLSLDSAALGILLLWATIGIWWLIRSHKVIEKTYISQ